MGRNARSVVDIGMEILRTQGAFEDPAEEAAEQAAPTATTEEVLGALVNQLQAMVDRLAIDERLGSLEAMMMNQALMLQTLSELIIQPRRRIPVRDEAGNIIEVMDVFVQPQPASEYDG